MPFNPVDFYELGGDLFNREGAAEREYRTVIGRAYYGAFLAARERAAIDKSKGAIHELTAEHYLKTNRSGIGNRLNGLRLMRNDADYDLAKKVDGKKAGEALKISRKVLEDLGVIS